MNHFTAWLVNDPSCLDQKCCDLTILQDEITGYTTDDEGKEAPIWSSNGQQVFHAVTMVNARSGDIADAQAQAQELLAGAGWQITGTWDALPNAYVATVERDNP